MRRPPFPWGGLAVALGVAGAVAAGCSSGPIAAVVRIGPAPVEFRVEVAETADQQRDGLTDREPLPEGSGMLIRFGNRAQHEVWMAGMTQPLDVAWISDGKVLAVDTLTPYSEPNQDQCPLWTSPSAVDALLEVPAHSLATVVPGMLVTVLEDSS